MVTPISHSSCMQLKSKAELWGSHAELDKFLSLLGIFQKLDLMAQGWPGCFRAGAATTLLVEAAHKLPFGQLQEVQTPHQVQGIPRLNTTTG